MATAALVPLRRERTLDERALCSERDGCWPSMYLLGIQKGATSESAPAHTARSQRAGLLTCALALWRAAASLYQLLHRNGLACGAVYNNTLGGGEDTAELFQPPGVLRNRREGVQEEKEVPHTPSSPPRRAAVPRVRVARETLR